LKTGTEKIIIAALSAAGACAVAYGMAKQNNPVFLAGIIAVIAAYFFIRRRLRASRED
jgi:NaMN:DMB phosphoribosyltransferase